VSAVCPAGVKTDFGRPSDGIEREVNYEQDPVELIVAGIVRQLDADVPIIYPSWLSKKSGIMFRLFPGFFDKVLSSGIRKKNQEPF
jgi:hypothetical protein